MDISGAVTFAPAVRGTHLLVAASPILPAALSHELAVVPATDEPGHEHDHDESACVCRNCSGNGGCGRKR